MERGARRRVPKFAFEFLQGGIGRESCIARNRAALDSVRLKPRYITDRFEPDLRARLFDLQFDAPFGVAPIGLSGLVWPRMAEILAAAAKAHNLPFMLSTYATSSLEEIHAIAGDHAWFQLYMPNEPDILEAMLRRAETAGYGTLVVTVDIPTTTRRERDVANGLAVPPRMNPAMFWQAALRPQWALRTLFTGLPQFKNLTPYLPDGLSLAEAARFLNDLVEGHISLDGLRHLRARWRGRLVVKGILSASDARDCQEAGVDAIVVSNHGGRQLDAAPTAGEVINEIRQAVGPEMPLIVDGGIRTGLDIARMIASGADFTLLGRAFVYAVAAIGENGGDHVMAILKEELRATMAQVGCRKLAGLADHLA